MPLSNRRGLFLDRDGILNELVFYPDTDEWESPRTPADLRLCPDLGVALPPFQEAGWDLFLVSNQPSYAKGKTSLQALQDVHEALVQGLVKEGLHLTEAC